MIVLFRPHIVIKMNIENIIPTFATHLYLMGKIGNLNCSHLVIFNLKYHTIRTGKQN